MAKMNSFKKLGFAFTLLFGAFAGFQIAPNLKDSYIDMPYEVLLLIFVFGLMFFSIIGAIRALFVKWFSLCIEKQYTRFSNAWFFTVFAFMLITSSFYEAAAFELSNAQLSFVILSICGVIQELVYLRLVARVNA